MGTRPDWGGVKKRLELTISLDWSSAGIGARVPPGIAPGHPANCAYAFAILLPVTFTAPTACAPPCNRGTGWDIMRVAASGRLPTFTNSD
jgi:hypothetical protein